ncbi:uncharacterized protein LOC102721579 isoform X2 [Oryza brachyantha]|uniref:uncharacterized protein LOC102721579 isoform X2 n=1 Tax=Oryza brachyantha TaxID=4533 RepID=UPI001ADA5F6F|nr:uncharacterized protein LOC102721579 isoform X2 [Oryza brachyantha]
MDDAWPARWPPPPPPAPAPAAPNQIDTANLRYLLRPFAAQQEAAGGAAPAPEQLAANHPGSQYGQPARAAAAPSNSLLAQVSGNHPHASHMPDLKALFGMPNGNNAASVIDLTRASPPRGVEPLLKHPRHGLAASSSVEQTTSLGALFQNTSANAPVSFAGKCSVNNGISQGASQFQNSSTCTMQKSPTKSTPCHQPALLGDQIRVSCLNVGGEFFVGGAGIFGVCCFCHRLRMSVAKFCEHSGGPAEKAGEIVVMDNGMTIGQWLKYCMGVGSSISDAKWDWPEWAHMRYSPEELWTKNLLIANSNMEKTGLFSGHGNNTGPIDNPVYSSDMHNEVGGLTSVEKLVNKPDETYYRKSVGLHEAFTKKPALQQSSKLNLANHTIHDMNLNSIRTPKVRTCSTANMGITYSRNHLAHDYANLLEKNLNNLSRSSGPSSTRVSRNDNRACMPDIPRKIFQDGSGRASNTELKLGQSSYHQSMTTLFPSVQSTIIEFQKPQEHLQFTTPNAYPKQTTNANKTIESIDPSFSTGNRKRPLEVANGTSHSELNEVTVDTAKNSFISLFLSHLERNSTSESIDDVLNSNEHYLLKAPDVAYSSDHLKAASTQVETRANDNQLKLTPAIIHTKRISNGRSLPVASKGYVHQDVLHGNSQEPSLNGDCLPQLLPSQPNAGISKICTEVSSPVNCRCCNHVADKSHLAHAETRAPCLYDRTARRYMSFDCADDLCTHKSLRATKISCQCGKAFCYTPSEFLPSFGQNDQSSLGKPIHRCCCKAQEDSSNLGFRAGNFCRSHFCNDGAPVPDHRSIVEGLDGARTCSTFIPRSSLCSRELMLQSCCQACPIDGFHYRSSMGHTANSLTKNPLVEAPNTTEHSPCQDGKCSCSLVPKCLVGYGFRKQCVARIDQTDHIVQKSKDGDVQAAARCCTLGESEKLICQCSSEIIARRNDSFQNEISNKVLNRPYVPISEQLKNVTEASAVGDHWPYETAREKESARRDSGIFKELKSGFSSGFSSDVVTKFSASPDGNNISSCTAKYGFEHKNYVFDEGSRIEKCSSSSYVPISTGCEEAQNSFSRFHLKPSLVKNKNNKISEGSKRKEHENEGQCSETPKKTRTLECCAKQSESDDYIMKINLSSLEGDSQPRHEAVPFSRRVSKTKRKHPPMRLNKHVKWLHKNYKVLDVDDERSDNKGILVGESNSSDREKQEDDVTTSARTKCQQQGSRLFARKLPKYVSLNGIVNEPNSEDACSGSASIDSSLIATGITNDNRKSPKIVPLSLILKKAKRCRTVKSLGKTEHAHFSEEKSSDCSVDKSSSSNRSFSSQDELWSPKNNRYSCNASRPHVKSDHQNPCHVLEEDELLSLADIGTSQLSASRSRGIKTRRACISLNRMERCEEFTNESACSSCGDKHSAVQVCEAKFERYAQRPSLDASCCVCGISNLEPCNQLIECSKCFIKVHQACYGVLKVPRGQWFCRPCKINIHDTVCVICGYGGGAMTRALKAKNILKSLLWGIATTRRSDKYAYSSGNGNSECTSSFHGEYVRHDSFHGPRSRSFNTISSIDMEEASIGSALGNITSQSWTSNPNSSLFGPRTRQWVHVVCGLWTPGTECPNAITMSAFDISGASPAKRNTECSICNRTGGSFMGCRDVHCSVLFHPWCAHQKGLLQSEPEGEHNENVGFYGRCLDHAMLGSNHVKLKECLKINDWTCARTEGFGGRKGDWFDANRSKKPEEKFGECSVSQEQINAWVRINGSKSCMRGQEYVHYKQLKGWKHLVVYKSGIHGLGLYTSEFIPRGSMVVEYVGEIVGQYVADKREIEYQSGKRQQYKSACYFFKIDKEHIIDATRKGGIARFINHSCQPNCVAKIISVRNEKKVVFFAERHINPGEEITYDYHFNREDEGHRIPCFCRSLGCRRYLN